MGQTKRRLIPSQKAPPSPTRRCCTTRNRPRWLRRGPAVSPSARGGQAACAAGAEKPADSSRGAAKVRRRRLDRAAIGEQIVTFLPGYQRASLGHCVPRRAPKWLVSGHAAGKSRGRLITRSALSDCRHNISGARPGAPFGRGDVLVRRSSDSRRQKKLERTHAFELQPLVYTQ